MLQKRSIFRNIIYNIFILSTVYIICWGFWQTADFRCWKLLDFIAIFQKFQKCFKNLKILSWKTSFQPLLLCVSYLSYLCSFVEWILYLIFTAGNLIRTKIYIFIYVLWNTNLLILLVHFSFTLLLIRQCFFFCFYFFSIFIIFFLNQNCSINTFSKAYGSRN